MRRGVIIAQTLQSWGEAQWTASRWLGYLQEARPRRTTSIPERRCLKARVLDARLDEADRQNR
jgi:hypothetical protein